MGNEDQSTNSNESTAVLQRQAQVAEMMQICERQVFELRRSGLLATVKVGNCIRFLRQDVMACIQNLRDRSSKKDR